MLFGKLQQGVRENEQFLTIARLRADAEDLYGQHIGDIIPETDKVQNGFQRDEGASVKKVGAYRGSVELRANEESRHTMESERKWRKLLANTVRLHRISATL